MKTWPTWILIKQQHNVHQAKIFDKWSKENTLKWNTLKQYLKLYLKVKIAEDFKFYLFYIFSNIFFLISLKSLAVLSTPRRKGKNVINIVKWNK